MAKCPLCKSKKGKRTCLRSEIPICSLCCGKSRNVESCTGCSFYQKPRRKYHEVPAFTTSEMSDSQELADYGNAIEGALCAYDIQLKVANEDRLTDRDAIKIIELLLDIYYFDDQEIDTENQKLAHAASYVGKAIDKDLTGKVDKKTLVKLLGVIRYVAKRRTKDGNEYMKIIHKYVGIRVDTGVRVLSHPI